MTEDRFALAATRQADDVELDTRVLFRALLRALRYLIPLLVLVAAAVFIGLGYVTPRYTAQTMVIIQPGETALTQAGDTAEDVRSLLDSEGVASQVQLIDSRDLAESVAKSLDLASIPEFDRLTLAERIQDFLAGYGIGKPSAISTDERVLHRFSEALEVYSVDKTRVITIAFSSSDPALSARVANAVADEYLALDRDAKRKATANATRWLETQIDDLRVRVADSEAKVETFRAANGLFMGGQNANLSLPQQRLDDLNAERARLEAARAAAEANAAAIRNALRSGGDLDVPEVLDSALIQRLREQQVALRAQIAQLSATLLSNHPRIRELSAQLGDLDAQIRGEAQRIQKSLESQVETAKARETEILADLKRTQSQTAQSNDAEVELRALQREATAQRDLLETYLRRYREATSRQAGDYLPADARVISRAAVPIEPSFPRRIPITAAVTVALLLLSITFVLLRELLSGRALRPVAPPARPEPTGDGMPRWDEGGPIRRIMPAALPGLPSLVAEMPDRLRPLVDRIGAIEARRIVVSPAAVENGAARPLAAVALARQLSRRGTRVLLLDLHADGADGTEMATESAKLPGFSELFAGSASFAQTIFRDRYSRAHIIPRGRGALTDGFSATARFETILDALDHTYEHVIIDADPALAARLAIDAAAVVLVAEEGLPESDREAAIERFGAVGKAEILVLVAAGEAETEAEAADPAAVA